MWVRGRSEKAVHTPRPFGDCQFLFAVGVSNAGVHIGEFAGFPQGFRLHEGRIALSTETGPSVSVQRFGSFACSGLWLVLFPSHRQGDSQANEDRASIRYRSTASHRRHNGIRCSVCD